MTWHCYFRSKKNVASAITTLVAASIPALLTFCGMTCQTKAQRQIAEARLAHEKGVVVAERDALRAKVEDLYAIIKKREYDLEQEQARYSRLSDEIQPFRITAMQRYGDDSAETLKALCSEITMVVERNELLISNLYTMRGQMVAIESEEKRHYSVQREQMTNGMVASEAFTRLRDGRVIIGRTIVGEPYIFTDLIGKLIEAYNDLQYTNAVALAKEAVGIYEESKQKISESKAKSGVMLVAGACSFPYLVLAEECISNGNYKEAQKYLDLAGGNAEYRVWRDFVQSALFMIISDLQGFSSIFNSYTKASKADKNIYYGLLCKGGFLFPKDISKKGYEQLVKEFGLTEMPETPRALKFGFPNGRETEPVILRWNGLGNVRPVPLHTGAPHGVELLQPKRGLAPPPTNDIQKAIWDRVKAEKAAATNAPAATPPAK